MQHLHMLHVHYLRTPCAIHLHYNVCVLQLCFTCNARTRALLTHYMCITSARRVRHMRMNNC